MNTERRHAGSRLRLVIWPINSIYPQQSYDSEKVTAEGSMNDAPPLTMTLFHDEAHPSELYVLFGPPER